MTPSIQVIMDVIWVTIGIAAGAFVVVVYEFLLSMTTDIADKKKAKRDSKIRPIAYRIWKDKGCPIGRDIENWQEAEAILREQHNRRR